MIPGLCISMMMMAIHSHYVLLLNNGVVKLLCKHMPHESQNWAIYSIDAMGVTCLLFIPQCLSAHSMETYVMTSWQLNLMK
jgi:hypothetical protein